MVSVSQPIVPVRARARALGSVVVELDRVGTVEDADGDVHDEDGHVGRRIGDAAVEALQDLGEDRFSARAVEASSMSGA